MDSVWTEVITEREYQLALKLLRTQEALETANGFLYEAGLIGVLVDEVNVESRSDCQKIINIVQQLDDNFVWPEENQNLS